MAVFWENWNLENLYLGDTGWNRLSFWLINQWCSFKLFVPSYFRPTLYLAPRLSRQPLVQILNVELYRRFEKQFSDAGYRNHKFVVVKHISSIFELHKWVAKFLRDKWKNRAKLRK